MRGLFEKQQLRSDKETLNLATALAEWQLLMKSRWRRRGATEAEVRKLADQLFTRHVNEIDAFLGDLN